VYCPKDRTVELAKGTLNGRLTVQHCSTCQGSWIPPEAYAGWKVEHPQTKTLANLIDQSLDVECSPSPLDIRAALCPECSAYLARAKVGGRNPFYVERCPNCHGIWCDRGEWDVLLSLGLDSVIDQMFSTEWQHRTREREQLAQERRATIDKLGPALAARLFELAEVLENHPNGDFGVAYLMRRFDNK